MFFIFFCILLSVTIPGPPCQKPMDSQDTCQGQVMGMGRGRDLKVGILKTLVVAQADRAHRRKSRIPLGSSWRSGKGAWRKGSAGRWWMSRTATARMLNVRQVWMWPWLPSTGISHVQVFPPAQVNILYRVSPYTLSHIINHHVLLNSTSKVVFTLIILLQPFYSHHSEPDTIKRLTGPS